MFTALKNLFNSDNCNIRIGTGNSNCNIRVGNGNSHVIINGKIISSNTQNESGPDVIEDRLKSGETFDQLQISTGIQCELSVGDYAIKIIGPKELQSLLNIVNHSGLLSIYVNGCCINSNLPRVLVSAPSLKSICASTSSIISGNVNSNALKLECTTGASINLKGSFTSTNITCSTGSTVSLKQINGLSLVTTTISTGSNANISSTVPLKIFGDLSCGSELDIHSNVLYTGVNVDISSNMSY